jgi:hypothetical protein
MEAKREINNLVKRKGLAHSLNKMFDKLISLGRLERSIYNDKYEGYTGEQIIEMLMGAYEECRYPTPESITKKYSPFDPLASSAPERFTHIIGREIIKKIENEFSLKISRELFHGGDWVRFRRIFFKEG